MQFNTSEFELSALKKVTTYNATIISTAMKK